MKEKIKELKPKLAKETANEMTEDEDKKGDEKNKKTESKFSDKPSKVNLDKIEQVEYTEKTESELWDEYYKRKPKFGTMVLITNKSEDEESNENDKRYECFAEKIYHSYKTRDQVEKMYDVLKNVIAADVSYMQNAYVYKGWMFCNFIALIWYYRLKQKINDIEMGNHYSPQDILEELNYHQIVKCNGEWTTVERTKKQTRHPR